MDYPKIFATNEPPLIKVKQEPGTEGTGQTNLIINYLPNDLTDEELYNMFAQVGGVVNHKIVRDRKSGQSLCYGFVELVNEDVATRAKGLWDRRVLRGKVLKVAFARPRSEEILNSNLYVAYLPPNINEAKLETLFGYYGTIIEAKVLRSKITGEPRGAGFVRFDQHMAAQMALNALDKHVLDGGTRPISVQWAKTGLKEPKKEKEHCCCCPRQQALNGVRVKEEPNASSGPFKRCSEPGNQKAAKRFCGNADPRLR